MINGIINVYKEKGFTSHDVVAKLRGIVRQKKIGHTGTLDPDAVGVLPVCLGKATRVCEFLTDETKTYETLLLLGRVTDTQDTSGETLEEKEVTCTEAELAACIDSFKGEQMQIPPMYSALKVNGKKLYELAREGKTVERKARPVCFYELELLECRLPEARIRVTCSKGTYIRTLCNDIGEKLGCGGCMKELIRTRVGNCQVERAYRLDEIRQLADRWRAEDSSRDERTPLPEAVLTEAGMLMPVDQLFAELGEVILSAEADALAHNGNRIPAKLIGKPPVINHAAEEQMASENGAGREKIASIASMDETAGVNRSLRERIRVYDSDKRFVGIFEWNGSSRDWKPEKMFYDPEA